MTKKELLETSTGRGLKEKNIADDLRHRVSIARMRATMREPAAGSTPANLENS